MSRQCEVQFVDEVPQDLICSICLDPAKDPQQTSCTCSRLYCSECLQSLRQTSGMCPTCRKALRAFPDGLSARRVRSLRVKCTNSHTGCPWVNEWVDLRDHIKTCAYELVACTTCNEKVFRGTLSAHMSSICTKRRHLCQHCKEEGVFEHMVGRHLEECPDLAITCPNSGCVVIAKRKDMESHSLECPKVTIDCPYAKVGCTFVCLRGDMDAHIRAAIQDHLDKAIMVIQQPHKVVVRLPEYSKKKAAGEVWYSPGFYTHPHGFKVCIRVYPNGCGDAKGTHLSVYINLMCGEHDSNLVWPLRAKFSVYLLNQVRDADHCINVITIDDKHNWCRLTWNSPAPGRGYSKFTPLSALNVNAQCQYLRDDRLYFRIESDVFPSCKPWLASIN